MSSIDVIFEVLPEEGVGDRSAAQVCEELQRQLADPRSDLRSGDFARYAAQATLSGTGLSGDAGGDARGGGGGARSSAAFGSDEPHETVVPPLPRAALETVILGNHSGAAGGGPPFGSTPGSLGAPFGSTQGSLGASHVGNGGGAAAGLWGPQGPYDSAAQGYGAQGAQGLTNAELVEKIARYEQQLARTAAGDPAAEPAVAYRQEPPLPPRRSSVEVEALEEKCMHYQHRLEAVEREVREAQEAVRTYRSRSEQLELKLKDREQLLVHAKEMWMKENVRASKLADALTSAEDKLADQEKRLGEVAERYNEAQQEVRQLQHLIGTAGEAVRMPSSAVDASFGAELMPRSAGGMPAGAAWRAGSRGLPGRPDSADLAGGTALPPPPFESETNAERFRRLCLLNDAVLYEDELLQIGVKAEYVGREGQFAVFFGNKGSAALQAFTVQYYVREEHALRLTASPMSQQLDADKQVVQRLSVVCAEPFVQPVWLRVQFLLPDTSPRRIQLQFPLVITKFMVGRELSTQDFFRYWRQQNFVVNEVTNIVHLAARLRGQLVHVTRSIIFGGALRLHHGVDANPSNFVLAGQLVGPSGAREAGGGLDAFGRAGDPEGGLSLVRVEVGSGRFAGKVRLVVRSSDPVVAQALCDCLVVQLAEPNAPPSGEAVAR